MNDKYKRLVQTSVTCFLYCGNEYLFVLRDKNKSVDPGRLNGIGGRLEKGENFLTAAIRETREETGYKTAKGDTRLCAVVKLEEGYDEDWVMCFFRIRVKNKKIPKPNSDEGEFIWLGKDKVLTSGYELVDDLTYTWPKIAGGKGVVFQTARLNKKQKIIASSISELNM